MLNTEAQRHGVFSDALANALCLCVSVLQKSRCWVFASLLLGSASAGAAEIHAVWDHTGRGLYPGNWPKTVQVLKSAHVTDLFVNVGGVDFANYSSSFLPKTQACKTYGDQLTACLRATQGAGIRVHAWFICFNATRQNPEFLDKCRRAGWRLKDKDGNLTTYLNPANANVRARVLAALGELTRYPVAGIQLDFIRWGDAAVKPSTAAATITSFVAEARRQVKRPKLLTAAVYGKYPNCIASVGQDWPRWLDFDLVDYIVPMDYAPTSAKFEELVRLQATPTSHARRTVTGIGVTSTGQKLSAKEVAAQIRLARKYGFAGQALFDLDATLAAEILPALRQGVW